MSALNDAKSRWTPPGRAPNLNSGANKKRAAISPARYAAAEVLFAVGQRRGHSDDLLHGRSLAGLSQEDKNLATALVLGVLRWQIALDGRIRPLLARPDVLPADTVFVALRLGAFQLLHMDRIPAHAAINESVELTRASGHPQAAGMVNAVLRKLSSSQPSAKPLHESTTALAERLSHPVWLVERWVKQFGRAATVAICDFNQSEPNCGQLFTDPLAFPMDDGSRLIAEITAAANPNPKRIWDCCAAPGGKTLVLASRHPDAELLATDVSSKRLNFLEQRLKQNGSNAKTLVADASKSSAVDGVFDLILCDVPCSGTGTLARNPEIKLQLRVEDLARQAERQRAILSSALQHLSSGGQLIYSTCSLEAEECERVVEDTLSKHNECSRLPIESIITRLTTAGMFTEGTDLRGCLREGMLRTLPGYNLPADGFFAALLTRH